MHLPGFVKKVMEYGIFVDLLHGLVGLVPNKVWKLIFDLFYRSKMMTVTLSMNIFNSDVHRMKLHYKV